MSSSPGNPLSGTHTASKDIRGERYTIAGISCSVYGLEKLPDDVQELAILWLLHPRLQKAATMAPIGAQAIDHWNQTRGSSKKGLIAVTFDQRNHGERMADKISNEAWRQGNERHAPDMFSIYQGTAQDTSLLIRHIQSYLPRTLQHLPCSHHTLGISLGGHSAWHLIVAEPRIQTAIIIIGCPDYTRLMLQRAGKSKLKSFQEGGAAGFLGSTDFPKALMEEINTADPAGMLLPVCLQAPASGDASIPDEEIESLKRRLSYTLKGKRIFTLSGGADKLVPYACGDVFYKFLKTATSTWWRDGDCQFKDVIYDGVGHETTPTMAKDAVEYLAQTLAAERRVPQSSRL